MTMKKHLFPILATLFAAVAGGFSQALPDAVAEFRRLNAELDEVAGRINAIVLEYGDHAEVVAAEKVYREASQEYLEFRMGFAPVTNAFKAMYLAKTQLWETVEAESAKVPEIAALRRKKEVSEGRRRELQFDLAEAKLRLEHPDSPINRALDRDPNLAALKEGKEPPDVASEAQKRWMMKTPYEEVRNSVRARMPEFEEVMETIRSVSNQLDQAVQDYVTSRQEIFGMQRAMYMGGNQACTEAKVALDQRMNDVAETYKLPEMKALKDAMMAAKKRVDGTQEEVAGRDPRMKALVERRETLEKEARAVAARLPKPGIPELEPGPRPPGIPEVEPGPQPQP